MNFFQRFPEILHVVMFKSVQIHCFIKPCAQENTVHNGGMVCLIGHHVVTPSNQGRDPPKVGLVAGAKDQSFFFSDKFGRDALPVPHAG